MKRIDSLVRSFVVGAGILLLASVGQAATITFNLTSDHCTGGCLQGQTSGGTITLTDAAGGGVDLTLALINGNLLVSTGLGGDFDIAYHLNGAPTVTYSALSGFTAPSNPQSASSRQFDGIGDFDYGLACATCGNGGGGGVGGTFSAHLSNVTTASFIQNSSGQYFGVDIISGTTGNTGAIDASLAAVPEPSTVILYGLGLTMLIVGQKWRKSREISANLN
jgi:hypothetical protein